MLSKEKILITGGSGLVGSAFPNSKNYFKASSEDADLRYLEHTIDLFKKTNPDIVIHCAAKVGGVGYNINANADFFLDNVRININVLETSMRFKVKKLISFLSTCIFPENVTYPLTEEKIYLGEPHRSNYGYAYSKRMLEVQSSVYREQYGVDFISVIPTNIYGPNDNFNINNGHVIPSLIHKCYLAKKTNSNLSVWGNGKALREFIYSEDVAKLTEWILKNYNKDEPLILSTSNEISIEYLVELIAKSMNFQGNILFDNTKPEGLFRKPTDTTKLKNILPGYEFVKIEDGIEKTVNWFIENYESARK